MSIESREHLSSFMDGEISEETSRFLVRRLGADSQLRSTWSRYHLVRDCLRHPEGDMLGIGLCGRVQQVLADEAQSPPTPKHAAVWSQEAWSKPGWLKPVAGMAIAASVALMAIITVGPGQGPVSPAADELAGSPQVESFVSPNNALAPASSPRLQQVSVMGGIGNSSQKMNSYLLRHYQMTGSVGSMGIITFVPIVVTQPTARVDVPANPKGDPGRLSVEGEDSQDNESSDNDSLDGANEIARQ